MNTVAPITKAEISASWNEAERKLDSIIKREGDADGARLEDSYFNQLLKEIIISKREAEKMRKGVMIHV